MTAQPPPGPPPGNVPPPPPEGYPPPPASGGAYPPAGAQPNNNLVWAILVTIFCCLPLGIVSIVKAAQVSGLWAQGRYAEANQAAQDAKKWAMWGAIIGVIGIVIYLIIAVTSGFMFSSNSGY